MNKSKDKSDGGANKDFSVEKNLAQDNGAESDSEKMKVSDLPIAEVRASNFSPWDVIMASRLWWLTLGCVIIAGLFVYFSLPKNGTEILIRFPEGHGLKRNDSVRHRGIDVGFVSSVGLAENLSSVDVRVELNPDAASLAREGSRFWIVKPEVSLRKISGLETAVGAKYIGVSPGPSDGKIAYDFDGLSTAPVDEFGEGKGIEVILRGERNYSLSPGSPVSYRGVEVGRIIAVNLSPDASYADVRASINPKYGRLLRTNSKFWVTSGVHIDGGVLKGFQFDTESIEALLRGGVSFVTVEDGLPSKPVSANQIYTLHRKSEESWLSAKNSVALYNFDLPNTGSLNATWDARRIAFMRTFSRDCVATFLQRQSGQLELLVPTDMADVPERAKKGSFQLKLNIGNSWNAKIALENVRVISEELVGIPLDPAIVSKLQKVSGIARPKPLTLQDFRSPTTREDCSAVKTVVGESGSSSIMFTIGQHEIRDLESVWHVTAKNPEGADSWHGCPVVSLKDGKIIGIMIGNKGQPIIIPYSDQWGSSGQE